MVADILYRFISFFNNFVPMFYVSALIEILKTTYHEDYFFFSNAFVG